MGFKPRHTTHLISFDRSDAWITLAIHWSSEGGRGGTLADILAVADGVNRAIPHHEEISETFTKLQQCGCLLVTDKRFRLSASLASLLDGALSKRGGLFTRIDVVEAALRASKHPQQTNQVLRISESELARAYKQYCKHIQSGLKRS